MNPAVGWSRAFAVQACSDFEARERLLRDRSLPHCHHLHYLQMAMEKAAKAHLIAGGCDPYSLQSSHVYIAKAIPNIVRDELSRTPGAKEGWLMEAVRALARRVELLHPQANHGGSVPANCEYPWESPAGHIVAPAEHDFALDMHKARVAVTMIKAVHARVQELAQASPP
jgi:hypothetical protein